MTTHSSATVRRETPHANRTIRTNTIINALKQRALSVLNDKSLDARTRAILRHALETNDPCGWLRWCAAQRAKLSPIRLIFRNNT